MNPVESQVTELLALLQAERAANPEGGALLIMLLDACEQDCCDALQPMRDAGFTAVKNTSMAERHNAGVWYGHWDVSW